MFTRQRVAVFVDGCFWHGCPDHYKEPTKNTWYWPTKIERTRQRDADTNSRLRQADWLPIRIWEHMNSVEAAHAVAAALYTRGGHDEGHRR